MVHSWIPLPAEGDGHLVREFIPASHRDLRMVRVFLPLVDDDRQPVRWSTFVSMSDASASLSWWEVADRVVDDHPEIRSLVSCRGELDDMTTSALQDAIGDRTLSSLCWMGYWGTPITENPVRIYQNDYFPAPLLRDGLRPGERVPEFVWDDEGAFAWGTRLYPDSLVIACEQHQFKELHADSRLDTVTVRVERDVMPPSSGD